ncbi:MAG: hypothetical protein HQL74_11865 [Magnetococcales bacterium]|nr:hypothetical protein [Magnetococcales bacterium]
MYTSGRNDQGGYILVTISVFSTLVMLMGAWMLRGLFVEDETGMETDLVELRHQWVMESGFQYLSYRAMSGSTLCKTQDEWQSALMNSTGYFGELGPNMVVSEFTTLGTTPNQSLQAKLSWTYTLPGITQNGAQYRLDTYFELKKNGNAFRLEAKSAPPSQGAANTVPVIGIAKNSLQGMDYDFVLSDIGYYAKAKTPVWPY